MKIEVNYLSSKWGKMLGTKVEVTLNECYSDALVPAYRIVRGSRKETIYRCNGNFWTEYPFMTCKKFIYELHCGLFCDLPMDKPVDDEWMANWLKAGDKLFWKVEEPFYYLDPFFSCPNDMVNASYENKGVVGIRRHFAPHQRKLALNYAELICNMVMRSDATKEPATPRAIIEVLNPDGTAKTLLEKRQFQCNHCRAVKFADQAILLDHLQDYHADILDEAGFPEEATEEDIIGDNFTEVFYEEDILCEDACDAEEKDSGRYRCKHCGAISGYDEESMWEHLQMNHPAEFAEDQDLETPDMIEIHWIKE